MEPGLIASYRYAEEVARSRSNFYYSFVVLPSRKRRAFCAVYAFMRYCDDISDGSGSTETKSTMLHDWRSQLEAAFSGALQGNPILPAFRDTVTAFSIPSEYFHWVIDGAEMPMRRIEGRPESYTRAVGLGIGEDRTGPVPAGGP